MYENHISITLYERIDALPDQCGFYVIIQSEFNISIRWICKKMIEQFEDLLSFVSPFVSQETLLFQPVDQDIEHYMYIFDV